jgi:Aldehyde ferredoxin oxidoreductase, N-terminal domain
VDFSQGKVLRVDLSEMTFSVEPLRMDWAALYAGGKGLLFRYLLDDVAPGLGPWSPNNPLMFFTGLFAGNGVSTCSRLLVGRKSPQTGTILDSYVGGSFGPELKFAGHDAIILTGRAADPALVWIKDDVVELRSARPYLGMKIGELESTLRRDLDPLMKAMSNKTASARPSRSTTSSTAGTITARRATQSSMSSASLLAPGVLKWQSWSSGSQARSCAPPGKRTSSAGERRSARSSEMPAPAVPGWRRACSTGRQAARRHRPQRAQHRAAGRTAHTGL